VWQRKVQARVRKATRQAERSLDVQVDRSGQLLGIFRELHEKSIARQAARRREPLWLARLQMAKVSPASPGQLSAVAQHFGKNCAIRVARSDGRPVAALVVLQSGAYSQAWRAAVDMQVAGSDNASKLLHRLAMEEACLDGCRFYDLTGAEPGSSLAIFKQRLGATMCFTHELTTERLPLRTVRTAQRWAVSRIVDRA
jgi:hypothetical protein